jgi:hypothetical protein
MEATCDSSAYVHRRSSIGTRSARTSFTGAIRIGLAEQRSVHLMAIPNADRGHGG